jgi:hypothetical protein
LKEQEGDAIGRAARTVHGWRRRESALSDGERSRRLCGSRLSLGRFGPNRGYGPAIG